MTTTAPTTSTLSASATLVSDILGDLTQYVNAPNLMQRTLMQAASLVADGTIQYVDATNPFVKLMEANCVTFSAFIQSNDANTRRLYPSAATTFDDLYRHMSDTDYVNMFALPSTATFEVIIEYQQLINNLVYDPTTGISQLTIPRNTYFSVAGTIFSIQYPINIRQLQHGALQAVYDATIVSPLQTLDTNVVPMAFFTDGNGIQYVQLSIDTQQFFINSQTNNVTQATGLVTQVSLTDLFYYCRVYVAMTSGNVVTGWNEIATTFTEQVYDATVPTAVLNVTDTTLTVTIPPVYAINGLIRGMIRIDTYQTKGPINMILSSYNPDSDFTAKWYAVDSTESTPETTAIKLITNIVIASLDTTDGGRPALTFAQMRERVIANSTGPRQIPITPAQIQAVQTDSGYTITKDVDVITGRAFWAAKALPPPTDLNPTATNNVFSPANANMLPVTLTIAQAASSQGCTVHATGMTVTSAALFQTVNGISSLVSTTAYTQLTALTLLEQAALINENSYFYTPFYYVLDDSTEVFDVRPYFLDQPTVVARTFIGENATTGLQASIADGYALTKTSTGYALTLTTTSNAAFQALPNNQVGCQLAFATADGSGTAFQVGTLQSVNSTTNERTYVFNFTTSYDITSAHAMDLTSFSIPGSTSVTPRTALTQTFSVLFYTTAPMPGTYVSSTIDAQLGTSQLGQGAVGLTYETLTLEFGNYLQTLWNSYRSYSSTLQYQTYPQDVPAVYTSVVYPTDPVTGGLTLNSDNTPNFTILHNVGDPILDSNGHPTYLHRAGDTVLDANGNPITMAGYTTQLTRLIDFFTLSAVYRFANDPITVAYVNYVESVLLTYITQDLVALNEQMLELTTASFYPAVSQGIVSVLIEDNALTSISADQSLKAVLYVTSDNAGNASLLASLTSSTIKGIGDYLAANTTISISSMQAYLLTIYGDDVVDVEISGLGGDVNNYNVVTLADASSRLSIGKILAVQTNNQMTVQEDVKVSFITHDTSLGVN